MEIDVILLVTVAPQKFVIDCKTRQNMHHDIMSAPSLVIIGAGAWGTALAMTLGQHHPVTLVASSFARAKDIGEERVNNKRLPNHALPASVEVTHSLESVEKAAHCLLAVPTTHLTSIITQLLPHDAKSRSYILCTKGMHDGALPYEMVRRHLQGQVAVLSGPNLAHEVAQSLPTASLLAADTMSQSLNLVNQLGHKFFRLYGSDDPLGCALGGAMKNVFAVGAAIIEGRGWGDNARAAFITRAQVEMMRLAVALGAKKETMSGLAGYGDLCLTAYSPLSRNWQLGFHIGQGLSITDALQKVSGVCEGFHSVLSIEKRATTGHISAPLIQGIADILCRDASVENVMHELLERPFTTE